MFPRVVVLSNWFDWVEEEHSIKTSPDLSLLMFFGEPIRPCNAFERVKGDVVLRDWSVGVVVRMIKRGQENEEGADGRRVEMDSNGGKEADGESGGE